MGFQSTTDALSREKLGSFNHSGISFTDHLCISLDLAHCVSVSRSHTHSRIGEKASSFSSQTMLSSQPKFCWCVRINIQTMPVDSFHVRHTFHFIIYFYWCMNTFYLLWSDRPFLPWAFSFFRMAQSVCSLLSAFLFSFSLLYLGLDSCQMRSWNQRQIRAIYKSNWNRFCCNLFFVLQYCVLW